MAILFAIWWCYFDVVGADRDRRIRTRGDAIALQIWTYAHLPLSMGVVIIGVGIQRVVTMATREAIPSSDVAMWLTGAALLAGALTSIGLTCRSATRARHGERLRPSDERTDQGSRLSAASPPCARQAIGIRAPDSNGCDAPA